MGRLRASGTVVALLLIAGISGCAGTPIASPTAGPGGAPGAEPTTSAAMPGLLGLSNAAITATDDRVTIGYGVDCGTLHSILDAGQWSVDMLVEPTGAIDLYLGAMRLEGRTAILRMTPSTGSCSATIDLPSEQTVHVAGADSIDGTAQYVPFGCAYDPDDEDGSVSLSAAYDGPDDAHLFIEATFSTATGTGDVDPDGLAVGISHGGDSLLALLSQAIRLSLGGADDSDISFDGVTAYEPDYDADDFVGSVTITSRDPLVGTLDLPGLVEEEGDATIDVTAAFRCVP